jgi:hypothetical protein
MIGKPDIVPSVTFNEATILAQLKNGELSEDDY